MIDSNWNKINNIFDALSNYHTIGTRLTNMSAGAHYSGNYWWSKSKHIKTLDYVLNKYYDPERWILSKLGTLGICLDRVGNVYYSYCINKQKTSQNPRVTVPIYTGIINIKNDLRFYFLATHFAIPAITRWKQKQNMLK